MKNKYQTEEERKAAIKAYQSRYYKEHKQERKEYWKKYYKDNIETLKQYRKDNAEHYKDYYSEYSKQRQNTQNGRAKNLVKNYAANDKKYDRGKCTLTSKWVVENIFSKPCHYCGETDWTKLGADRIDNSKPHTPDNVVPCCMKCNWKKHTTEYEDFKKPTNHTVQMLFLQLR